MSALPSVGTTDPWPEILHHLSTKVTFKGQPVVGPAEQIQGFARWLMQQMPGVVPAGDPETRANCFLGWLRSESTYEADEAARMAAAAAIKQAPPNPISDQTVPQLAQPVAAPAPAPVAPAAPAAPGEEAAAGPGLTCPECGATLKNLTGMKRHCTMTHKADWSVIAQKHGLDISTGGKLNGAPSVAAQAAPAAPVAPPPPPSAAAVPPMFGAPGQATSAPPSFAAPPPPQVGQTSISFQPPQVPAMPPPMHAPTMFQQMPAPPAQVAAAPQAPMSGPAAPQFTPPSFTPPQQFVQQPTAGPMVAFNPNAQPAAPQPFAATFGTPNTAPAPQQAAPQVFAGAPTRESMAQMLGGAVDLVVVRLLDAATVKLDGRTDVNQLALLAESKAKAEQKVVDLAQSAYGAGKQAAQRHFADLLTQHPNCYLLQNGYEPILPAGYLEILAARVTKFHIVTDSGRQTTTIFA
jgi:hypothetical protein